MVKMAAPYQYPQYQPQQQYQPSQQYQPPQPYQQQSANGHSGYHQQNQQQQYPSQQSPTQQYASHNYQQQYLQTQHPQQQSAPSQYSNQHHANANYRTQQYVATHQGRYQDAQGSYGQPSAQASSQTCFNCGVPGHFAQDCPEPKRQVPAGALNPEQHRRQGIAPPKRGGQIVTKFGPQGPLSQGSPGPYTPAYSSGGYPQQPPSHAQIYTPAYTPITPQSAPSPAQTWPQKGQQHTQQYPGYQQTQSNGHYQASPPQQPWPTPNTPASGAAHGTPYANQASPSHSQFSQPARTPQSQYGQGWGTPVQSTQQSPTSPRQLEGGYANDSASKDQQTEDSQSIALGTRLFSPKPPIDDAEDVELEEDDLFSLDVPDFPPSTAQYGESLVPLVGMPIPANFVVADALFPMDPPAPEANGRCQSKYVRTFQADALSMNIKQSIYWKDHKEDVIFASIPTDGDLVSFDECRSMVREHQKSQEELLREGRSESRSAVPPRRDVVEAAASLEQLEKALAQAKADIANREKKQKEKKGVQSPVEAHRPIKGEEMSVKTEPMSPPQHATIESGAGYENDPEDVLASLGVTGTAKPIGPPTRLVSQNSSSMEEIKSRSGSASKADR